MKPILMIRHCVYLFCLLIFCVSCHHKEQWHVSRVAAGDPLYSSSKLSSYAKDTVHGLDVEILALHDSSHMYLVIHSHPVTAYKHDPKKAVVLIESEGKQQSGLALRHEGGQRLLVPDELKDFVIESLLSQKPVTIKIPGYKTELSPDDFTTSYDKLLHPFPISNPLRSPFTH